MFDTINCNSLLRLVTTTMEEDILRLLPSVAHDPVMVVKPAELRRALPNAKLVSGHFTGLGPRGIARPGVPTLGCLPLSATLHMGKLRNPTGPGPACG